MAGDSIAPGTEAAVVAVAGIEAYFELAIDIGSEAGSGLVVEIVAGRLELEAEHLNWV